MVRLAVNVKWGGGWFGGWFGVWFEFSKTESNNYLITTCLTHYLTNKVCFWLCTKKMTLANDELYITLGNDALYTRRSRLLANLRLCWFSQ